MNKQELCNEFKKIKNAALSDDDRIQRCIDLYNESTQWNRKWCYHEIFKILGLIPQDILDSEQLLEELGEPNNYTNITKYMNDKQHKNDKA